MQQFWEQSRFRRHPRCHHPLQARSEPFIRKQIELVQTFAIENARLFEELEARTGELSRSADEVIALGDEL